MRTRQRGISTVGRPSAPTLLKNLAGGLGGILGGGAAMGQSRGFGRQDDFGGVDFSAAQGFETGRSRPMAGR